MAQGVFFIVSPVANTIHATYLKTLTFIKNVAAASATTGASFVSLYDTASYYAGVTVEAALAELGALTAKTITDPGDAGAIPVTRSGTVPIVTAGAETRTLAIPTFVNQKLVLFMQTDGGDCGVTVASAINQAGNTIITMNDVNDSILLTGIYNGTALAWRVTYNNGCTLS